MGTEIERKFLIDHRFILPIAEDCHKPSFIEQAYISLDVPYTRVRVVNGEEAYITIKGSGSINRKEFEYDLPLNDAKEIIKMSSYVVRKTRRYIKHTGNIWELDHFGGYLYLAEIELKSEDQQFVKPPWVTKEVTYDKRYTNVYISQFGFPGEV